MSDAAIAPLLVSETRGLAVTTERLPVKSLMIRSRRSLLWRDSNISLFKPYASDGGCL